MTLVKISLNNIYLSFCFKFNSQLSMHFIVSLDVFFFQEKSVFIFSPTLGHSRLSFYLFSVIYLFLVVKIINTIFINNLTKLLIMNDFDIKYIMVFETLFLLWVLTCAIHCTQSTKLNSWIITFILITPFIRISTK